MNCLSVYDHFVGLALKVLSSAQLLFKQMSSCPLKIQGPGDNTALRIAANLESTS